MTNLSSGDLPSSGKDRTLHRRILTEIESKIVTGEWPVGYRIPFEIDLAKQYGVSRMTVNKVLTQLARAGLIDRVKRSGSFVGRPRSQSAVLEINDIAKEVESLQLAYRFELRKRVVRMGNADLPMLEAGEDAQLLEIEVVHWAGEKPFCLERRFINLNTVPDAKTADFASVSPGQWLLSRVPWSSAEHRIEAVASDRSVAAALHIGKGTPCLVIQRRTWSSAGLVTHVRLAYPGDRHALFARFTPAS